MRWKLLTAATLAVSAGARAHGVADVVQQSSMDGRAVVESPALDGLVRPGTSWMVTTPAVMEHAWGGLRLAGPDWGLREQALIGVRSVSISLGSVHWAGETALAGSGLRLVHAADLRVALFHSSRGGAPFVPDRSVSLELCGSQSVVAAFVGLRLASRLTFGLMAELQDDPFHYRWLSGILAGTGCLGHPPVWTSSEMGGAEVRYAAAAGVDLKAFLRKEAQRVTYAIGDDTFGMVSAGQTMVGLSLEVHGRL